MGFCCGRWFLGAWSRFVWPRGRWHDCTLTGARTRAPLRSGRAQEALGCAATLQVRSPFERPAFWDEPPGPATQLTIGQPGTPGRRVPPGWDPLAAAPFAWDLPEPAALRQSRPAEGPARATWLAAGMLLLTAFAGHQGRHRRVVAQMNLDPERSPDHPPMAVATNTLANPPPTSRCRPSPRKLQRRGGRRPLGRTPPPGQDNSGCRLTPAQSSHHRRQPPGSAHCRTPPANPPAPPGKAIPCRPTR